jgi:hypothetical protein
MPPHVLRPGVQCVRDRIAIPVFVLGLDSENHVTWDRRGNEIRFTLYVRFQDEGRVR